MSNNEEYIMVGNKKLTEDQMADVYSLLGHFALMATDSDGVVRFGNHAVDADHVSTFLSMGAFYFGWKSAEMMYEQEKRKEWS